MKAGGISFSCRIKDVRSLAARLEWKISLGQRVRALRIHFQTLLKPPALGDGGTLVLAEP